MGCGHESADTARVAAAAIAERLRARRAIYFHTSKQHCLLLSLAGGLTRASLTASSPVKSVRQPCSCPLRLLKNGWTRLKHHYESKAFYKYRTYSCAHVCAVLQATSAASLCGEATAHSTCYFGSARHLQHPLPSLYSSCNGALLQSFIATSSRPSTRRQRGQLRARTHSRRTTTPFGCLPTWYSQRHDDHFPHLS